MGKAKMISGFNLGWYALFVIVHDKKILFGCVCLPHRRPILWPHVYIFIPANDSTVGRDGMLPLRAPLTPSWWRDPDAVTSVTTGYTTQLRSRVFCLFSLMLSNFIIHLRGGSERNQFPLMCIMGIVYCPKIGFFAIRPQILSTVRL